MAEFQFKIYFKDKISSLFLLQYTLLLYKHKGNPLIWPLEWIFFRFIHKKHIFYRIYFIYCISQFICCNVGSFVTTFSIIPIIKNTYIMHMQICVYALFKTLYLLNKYLLLFNIDTCIHVCVCILEMLCTIKFFFWRRVKENDIAVAGIIY